MKSELTYFKVFHQTSHCYALVNIKPILAGHVLVIPFRPVQRLTDLTLDEVTSVFTTVQRVQRMLAKVYFTSTNNESSNLLEGGSFNIAIQDGKDAGQTVPHVHCHIIPRTRVNENEVGEGDGIYDRLQGEEGNVGGGLWDLSKRPEQVGKFPVIEDEDRRARSKEEM